MRLVNLTKKSDGGTAVKVEVNGRWFLATAEHVVRNEFDDIRALIPGRVNAFVSSFLSRAVDSDNDIAILEVSESDAKRLGDFVQSNELESSFDSKSDHQLVVAGHPGQLVNSKDELILATHVATVHDFASAAYFTRSWTYEE